VSIFRTWGSRPEERVAVYPCQALIDPVDDIYYRAVSIDAPPGVVFRWVCQLRVAPYSYDWIDNLGRRSPRTLTPGLERLEVGQRVMTIFRLVSFVEGEHLTVVMDRPFAVRLFGQLAATYAVAPDGAQTRLVVCVPVRYPPGLLGRLLRVLLPVGDFVMMRKQLLTLKALAESVHEPPRE